MSKKQKWNKFIKKFWKFGSYYEKSNHEEKFWNFFIADFQIIKIDKFIIYKYFLVLFSYNMKSYSMIYKKYFNFKFILYKFCWYIL